MLLEARPEEGLKTVTAAVPGEAMSAVVMAACRRVAET